MGLVCSCLHFFAPLKKTKNGKLNQEIFINMLLLYRFVGKFTKCHICLVHYYSTNIATVTIRYICCVPFMAFNV